MEDSGLIGWVFDILLGLKSAQWQNDDVCNGGVRAFACIVLPLCVFACERGDARWLCHPTQPVKGVIRDALCFSLSLCALKTKTSPSARRAAMQFIFTHTHTCMAEIHARINLQNLQTRKQWPHYGNETCGCTSHRTQRACGNKSPTNYFLLTSARLMQSALFFLKLVVCLVGPVPFKKDMWGFWNSNIFYLGTYNNKIAGQIIFIA
jgi:hypothetical protein